MSPLMQIVSALGKLHEGSTLVHYEYSCSIHAELTSVVEFWALPLALLTATTYCKQYVVCSLFGATCTCKLVDTTRVC